MKWFFLVAVVLTTLFISTMASWPYDRTYASELAVAWLISVGHGGAACWMSHRAIAHGPGKFLAWGLGMNGIRVLVLLALLWIVQRSGVLEVGPFFAAVLVGYFCFLAVEIVYLHIRSCKGYGSAT